MKKILWISPILNHYKARRIDRFIRYTGFDVVYLKGILDQKIGHQSDNENKNYKQISVPASKNMFGFSFSVYKKIFQEILNNSYDILISPPENKFIALNCYLYALRIFFKFSLVAYTHPPKAHHNKYRFVESLLFRFIINLYDKIVFYTEGSMN